MIDLSSMLAVSGAAAATGKWLYEWTKKAEWEKNRYLLEQLENFQQKENTKAVQQILDWNSSSVLIDGKLIKVNDDLLSSSLTLHTQKGRFSPEELILRNSFDEYFDDLGMFIFMIQVDLISEKHFTNFMKYWFRVINGQSRKSKEISAKFHTYLEFYGYAELRKFILKQSI